MPAVEAPQGVGREVEDMQAVEVLEQGGVGDVVQSVSGVPLEALQACRGEGVREGL